MKLRLPHKLQTALLAAVASVSFTTVSSATLGAAAAWAFFSGHAGAEDLTHDPILTQQLDHAKKIEFGKLSLSETGAEQVEPSVAKSSFGSGDVAHLAAAATLGGDIVDAVLCEGYSEAGGSWQADAAALSAALDPAATSEFVTAEGLATVDSGEPVFSTTAAAAPAAAATSSSLDLAPQQTNSYEGTAGSSSNNTSVSAPAVGAGAGAGSVGGGSGYVASSRSSRPVVMKTAGVTLQDVTTTDAATQDSVSVNLQDSLAYDEITRQETAPQPRLAADAVDAQSTPANSGTLLNVTPEGFTANPYATVSDTSNGSDDFSLTGTAPAAAYVPGQSGVYAEEGDSAAGTGSGSSTNKTTTGAIGSIGGTGSGAIGGSVARPMALTAPNMLSPVSSLSVGGTSLGGDSGSLPVSATLGAADAGLTTYTTTNSVSTATSNFNAKGFIITLDGPRLQTNPECTYELVYLDSLTLASLRALPNSRSVTLALADAQGKVLSVSNNVVSSTGQATWEFNNTAVATDSPPVFLLARYSKRDCQGGHPHQC